MITNEYLVPQWTRESDLRLLYTALANEALIHRARAIASMHSQPRHYQLGPDGRVVEVPVVARVR